jgi:hypothetical protein
MLSSLPESFTPAEFAEWALTTNADLTKKLKQVLH